MGIKTSAEGKAVAACRELTPGRCQATDWRTGKRCVFTWTASPKWRKYCQRCTARLTQQRHRASLKANNGQEGDN